MSPVLALVLTIALVIYLYRRGFDLDYNPSLALWLPTIWFMILMSRSVTQWLNLSPSSVVMSQSAEDLVDGSPADRFVFAVLIGLGVIVLWSRHLAWTEIFRHNTFLVIFIFYCAISCVWSDFPLTALKRWAKGLGDPIMILVMLTEGKPLRAVEIVIRRCAYVVLPFSVLFMKYYPEYGKVYDEWTGYGMYTGVTTNKNILGFVLLVCGLFFTWRVAIELGNRSWAKKKENLLIPIGMLFIIGWLFNMANSQTSLLSCLLAITVALLLGIENVRKRVSIYLVAGILSVLILNVTFDLNKEIVEAAGRNMTLTGRTEIWDSALQKVTNPFLGAGFESFWLGDRLKNMWAEFYFKPNQAHNGYIEVYLNLGVIGLFLLGGVISSCYWKMRKLLTANARTTENVNFGRLGMGFLIAYLAYNHTEAAFKSLHLMYLVFLIFAIKFPQVEQKVTPVPQSLSSARQTVTSHPDNANRSWLE